MGSNPMTLAEGAHIVNILAPVDINGGVSSDVFDMGGYSHVDIIIQLGVTGAASTVTVEECDDFTPTTHTEIDFSYYSETTANGDTLTNVGAIGATTGFATSTNNGIFYVISIDASQLTQGYPKLRISFSNPSASTMGSAVAILTGARHGVDQSATVIA